MHTKPALSTQRFTRLRTWARLWLVWMASVLAEIAHGPLADKVRRHIDDTAWVVQALIVAGMLKRIPAKPRRHGGPPRSPRLPSIRAIIGAKLHRRLRGRDLKKRVGSLIALVRDMDRAIASVVRRMRKGCTRRRGAVCAPPLALFAATAFAAPATSLGSRESEDPSRRR